MARARNIKPGLFVNCELGELAPVVRLLFIGLWCLADKDGRLKDKPKSIKVQILPWDDVDVDELLGQLDPLFIRRYEVDGGRYIQINNFERHQHPHPNEKSQGFPELPCNYTTSHEKKLNLVSNRDESLLMFNDSPILNPDSPINISSSNFDQFWAAYPRKVGKADALKKWQKINPDSALIEKIMTAVEVASQSEQWNEAGGKYIPHPATWLNQGRWDDEPLPQTDSNRLPKGLADLKEWSEAP